MGYVELVLSSIAIEKAEQCGDKHKPRKVGDKAFFCACEFAEVFQC